MSGQWEVRIEWGVRRLHGAVGSVAEVMNERMAQAVAEKWSGEVVRREVRIGPWGTA